jgi:hypothetical protein
MHAFYGDLLVTWQADILTRLVEVIYENHGWRMPGGVLVGDHSDMDRDTLTRIYLTAAKKIKKETVTKKAVGLSAQYYSALQRYDEVSLPTAHEFLLSPDPPPNTSRSSIYGVRTLIERNVISHGGSHRRSPHGRGCTTSGANCSQCAIDEQFRRALRFSEAATRALSGLLRDRAWSIWQNYSFQTRM